MTRPHHAKGFTLIELMITLVIVGIVAMIGVPSYLDYVRAAERSEAITTLNDMVMRAEEFRARTNAYPGSLTDLGYTTTTVGGFTTVTTDNYTYTTPLDPTTTSVDTCTNENCLVVFARVNIANHTDDECHVLVLTTNGGRFEQNRQQDGNGNDLGDNEAENCW